MRVFKLQGHVNKNLAIKDGVNLMVTYLEIKWLSTRLRQR